MSSRRRRGTVFWAGLMVGLGAALLVLMLLPLARGGDAVSGELVGRRAPALEALDLDGRRWTLDDAEGRVVWINYWATWCPPCRTEMPMMQRLHERYADRVLILGVDFGEERGAVEDFVARYGVTYPILLDPTLDNYYRWSPTFGLPKHYFIDANGIVIREVAGELPPQAMLAMLRQVLGESAAERVAGPADVHFDPSLPEPLGLEPGSVIEPGFEYPYRFYVHCGIEWLGTFNDVAWRADLPDGSAGGLPPEWPVPGADQTIEITIVLGTDPEPVIEATAGDRTIIYRPTAAEPPGCD